MLKSRRPTQTLTIFAPTLVDDGHGNEVKTYSDSGTEAQGYLDQQQASEDHDARDAYVSSWVAIFPDPGTTITAGSQVSDGVNLFDVEGVPWVVRTLGGPHHTLVTLRAVTG